MDSEVEVMDNSYEHCHCLLATFCKQNQQGYTGKVIAISFWNVSYCTHLSIKVKAFNWVALTMNDNLVVIPDVPLDIALILDTATFVSPVPFVVAWTHIPFVVIQALSIFILPFIWQPVLRCDCPIL